MNEMRVAIIGAGISGLASARESLLHGLVPTVYEKTDNIGGMWRRGFWKSFKSVTDKYNCAFSSKQWPRSVELFPKKDQMVNYIGEFAEENGLLKYVEANSSVVSCVEMPDKRWKLTVDTGGGRGERVFDFLIVASGLYSDPKPASIPDLDRFAGKTLHSSQYVSVDDSIKEGKRVLVVGGSFSGCEIANDIATHPGLEVLHLVRPSLPQLVPLKSTPRRRSLHPYTNTLLFKNDLPQKDTQRLASVSRPLPKCGRMKVANDRTALISLKLIREDVLGSISDAYKDKIAAGRIEVIRDEVIAVRGKTVIFGNDRFEEVDVVVLATGFATSLPFFSPQDLQKLAGGVSDGSSPLFLYQHVLSTSFRNLGFVGISKNISFPMVELQARLIVGLFAGTQKRPSEFVMRKRIKGLTLGTPGQALLSQPVDRAQQVMNMAAVLGHSPLTIGLHESFPLVHHALVSKPFCSAVINFVGPSAKPVASFLSFSNMLEDFREPLSKAERKQFLQWVASFDPNFYVFFNMLKGVMGFDRATTDLQTGNSKYYSGYVCFLDDNEFKRSYSESVNPAHNVNWDFFKNTEVNFKVDTNAISVRVGKASFDLNFKRGLKTASATVEQAGERRELELVVNATRSFSINYEVRTKDGGFKVRTTYNIDR